MTEIEELKNENISLKCELNLKNAQIERLKGLSNLRKISERFLKDFGIYEESMHS